MTSVENPHRIGLTKAPEQNKYKAQIARDDPFMAPSKDAGEDIAMRRRRLRYRAWHRGTKEMDLVLGPYADAHADALGEAELLRLETLMDEEDTDLLKWVMGQEMPPAAVDSALLAEIIAFRIAK
jgi:antitoxin CptB